MAETSREKLLAYVHEGDKALRHRPTVLKVLDRFGDDWFTDDQVRDMAEHAVKEWRSLQQNKIRNRRRAANI